MKKNNPTANGGAGVLSPTAHRGSNAIYDIFMGTPDHQGKAYLDYVTTQTLEQSNLPLKIREDVYREARGFIDVKDHEGLRMMMERRSLSERFGRNYEGGGVEERQNFIKNDLPGIRKVRAKGLSPKNIDWRKTFAQSKQAQAATSKIAGLFSSAGGFADNTFNVSFKGGVEAHFPVQGLDSIQRSSVMEMNFNMPVYGIKATIPIYTPSNEGFVAQSRDSFKKGFTKGEALYMTPQSFFTGLRFNDQTMEPEIDHFKGQNAYVDFQFKQVEQLAARMKRVSNNPKLSHRDKSKKMKSLLKEIKLSNERAQTFVASAGALGGAAEAAGQGGAIQNLLSKAAVQRQSSKFEIALAEKYSIDDPRIPLKLMGARGAEVIGSAGMAGKYTAVQDANYSPGVLKLPHEEPTKAISEISFTNYSETKTGRGLVPRYEDLYKGKNESLVEGKLFKPTGVSMIGRLIPDTMHMGEKHGFGKTELLAPDGTFIVGERLFRSGDLDASFLGGYEVKTTGVSSTEGGLFSGTAAALTEGGTVYAGSDLKRKNPIQIPGLRGIVDQGEDADLYRALGLSDASEFKKVFPGGVALERGELLGLDPTTGRSVRASDDRNIRESIFSIGRTSGSNSMTFDTIRHVSGFETKGEYVAPDHKLVSSFIVRGGGGQKLQSIQASNQQLHNIFLAAHQRPPAPSGPETRAPVEALMEGLDKVEVLFNKGIVRDESVRLTTMAGAYRFEMEDQLKGLHQALGSAKTNKQQAAKQAFKELASMPNLELLKSLSSGDILPNLQAITALSQDSFDNVAKIIGAKAGVSMDQKIAAMSYATFGGLEDKKKVRALGNVFGLYNKLGDQIGLDSYGAKANEEIVKRYFQWGGETEATAIRGAEAQAWREGKTLRNELDTAFSGALVGSKKLSDEVLDSYTPHQFYTVGSSIRDTHGVLGSGSRATIEPRFFDIARSKKSETHPLFKEITSRGANYKDVLDELSWTVKGQVPLGLDSIDVKTALSRDYSHRIGTERFAVDLGISKDEMVKVDEMMKRLNPELKANARSSLYLPGGEHIQGMGIMVTGDGAERNKPIRSLYVNYMKEVDSAKGLMGHTRIEALAEATNEFQSNVQRAFSLQVHGAPKGGQSGVLRTRVEGSAYLHARALGPDLLEGLGALPQTKFMSKKRKTAVANMKKELKHAITEGGESMGRQVFLSERSAVKMFGETMQHAKKAGNMELHDLAKTQLSTLKRGGSVLMGVSRHPGIGINSLTSARVYMDHMSAKSSTDHYFRMGMEYMDVMKEGKNEQWMTSLAQDLASDLDGDRINLFAAVSKESQKALGSMMKNEHRHAIRYQTVKEVVKESMARGARKSSSSGNGMGSFNTASFNKKENAFFRMEAKKLSSGLAHSATNQVVPKISNLFSEMKMMTTTSSLGDSSRELLFQFFEAAEQVPISSKNLAEHADYTLDVVEQLFRVKAGLSGDKKQRDSAINSMFDLLGDSSVVDDLDLDFGNSLNKHRVTSGDVEGLRGSMIQAADDFHSSAGNQDVMNLFRKKNVGDVSSEVFDKAFSKLSGDLHSVYGQPLRSAAQPQAQGSGAKASRELLQDLVSSVKRKGANAGSSLKGKIPMAGMAGLAAAGVAASGLATAAGLALAPTWRDSKSHENFVDPDLLFPDELQSQHGALHGNSMPTAVTGNIATSSYEATIHAPAGSPGAPSLVGRLNSMLHGRSGSARLDIQDHRSSLDTFRLQQIQDEII